nr:hypothetical protein [Gammaproteobacteria bacterium]
MTDTTFAVVFLLSSSVLTAVLYRINRFNQQLTAPAHSPQHWIWSEHLNRAGVWLLMVGNILIWTATVIGGLRLVPIQIGGSSVLGGFLCLLIAAPLIGSALLWRLQCRYGLRQLAQQLTVAIKQRLPKQPARQTVLQVLQFSGQLCLATVAVGWGLLRVIAMSGVLDEHNEEQIPTDFFNHSTMKYDNGTDVGGV